MTPEFWYTALGLLVVRIIWDVVFIAPWEKRYREAVGKRKGNIKLSEGSREAAKLTSIIDKAEMERHPDDRYRLFEGKEFKKYMNESGLTAMLITIAHEVGCEFVLRRMSDEDIESETNRGGVFDERYRKIAEPFNTYRRHEYKKMMKREEG